MMCSDGQDRESLVTITSEINKSELARLARILSSEDLQKCIDEVVATLECCMDDMIDVQYRHEMKLRKEISSKVVHLKGPA